MNQLHKTKQISIVSFLVVSMGFASFCCGQDSAKAGGYVRYSVKTNQRLEVIVGVLLKSENEMIHVFDLKTFSERKIDPKNVLRKKAPISESEAASRIGVAPIVAWNLKDLIPKPPKPGKVALVDGAVIYVNLGKKSGIRVGSELDVFRGEDVIKDPETGEVLGRNRRKIAKVEVLEVREKLSKVKLLGALELKLKVGDVVESDRKSRSIAVLSSTNASGAFLKSGVALSDEITSALMKFKVSIVERTKLTDVIRELATQRTGIFDNKTVQKLGRQVGAFAVLSGTIIPIGQKSKVSVRLVEVETGKILYASTFEVRRIGTNIASASDARTRWINESYKTKLRRTKNGVWQEIENKTGRVRFEYKEVTRTRDYVELFLPKRKQKIRLIATRMELWKDGKWGWVANGHWEKSSIAPVGKNGKLPDSDSRTLWINETYKVTVRRTKDGAWQEPRGSRRKWEYKEVTRTAEYVELYCPVRKYKIRIFANRMELWKDGKWGRVAKGRWNTAK